MDQQSRSQNLAQKERRAKTVAVVGLGYVGLPLALQAQSRGYQVIGVDRDQGKVSSITKKVVPFEDSELQQKLLSFPIEATSDLSRLTDAGTIIVCVPTPVNHDHTPDLEPLKTATSSVARFVRPDTLIVIESTVNPGVCSGIVTPILNTESPYKVGRELLLAHCPERINPGDAKWNVGNIPRVVGASTPEGLVRAVAFYQSIVDAPVTPMRSIAEAEAVKVVENSFRDINIAFVNELAMSFSKLGIDVVEVINGASTKPFAFMAHFPGCGVGGHCIPVDPYYLIDVGRQNGFSHDFLSLARRINERMPRYTVDILERELAACHLPLYGSKIAVLGLAYKPDIDDCRESPSFAIIEEIANRGGIPIAYDPYVPDRSSVPSLKQALSGARAAVIATAHQKFRELSPAQFKRYGIEVIIDGRNCLSRDEYLAEGLNYAGIGR